MLNKIKRKDCLSQYPSFPTRRYDTTIDEEIFFYPASFRSYILTLISKSFKGHLRILGEALKSLMNELHFEHLIFLGDTKLAWLCQDNDFKPVKEAMDYLTNNKIGKRFNGGIEVSRSEIPTFVKHLCWLTRSNASLPMIYFTDKNQNFIASICKYGNIHFETMNKDTDYALNTLIDKSPFNFLDKNNCYNQHGKTSAINSRKIII